MSNKTKILLQKQDFEWQPLETYYDEKNIELLEEIEEEGEYDELKKCWKTSRHEVSDELYQHLKKTYSRKEK